MLALALKHWRALAVVGFVLAILAYHWNAVRVARNEGREAERQAAIVAAGKRIIEMEKNNEAFRNLPARERCLVFMRDSGMPEHHCGER